MDRQDQEDQVILLQHLLLKELETVDKVDLIQVLPAVVAAVVANKVQMDKQDQEMEETEVLLLQRSLVQVQEVMENQDHQQDDGLPAVAEDLFMLLLHMQNKVEQEAVVMEEL